MFLELYHVRYWLYFQYTDLCNAISNDSNLKQWTIHVIALFPARSYGN